jgi:hypothetical protein
MFRTLNNRGKTRSNFFRNFQGTKNGKVQLNPEQLKLIESSQAITLGEKIELLLVSLGNKLTTELYMKISFERGKDSQLEEPNPAKVEQISKLLQKLPFEYFQDHQIQKNRQTQHPQNFTWFQVSVNEAVSHFMKDYPDDLTEFEEGILYGFPLSAIRAYTGLITEDHTKNTPASYYLAGVCSKDFWQDEQEYYQYWWEKLGKLSPKIVAEAEEKGKNL